MNYNKYIIIVCVIVIFICINYFYNNEIEKLNNMSVG